MKTIILGISGSIAAYKAADITNALTKHGINVHVLMTKNAVSFITPFTLQCLSKNKVYSDVMTEPESAVHVKLAKQADLFVVAPASANIIARLAAGFADDMLTSAALAAKNIPLFVAPAMHTNMYENPAVRNNLSVLQKRGWKIIEPRESRLACGDKGKGAMADVEVIVKIVLEALK